MARTRPPLLVATGADERFARSLERLLGSLPRAGPSAGEARVYDLGLLPATRSRLAADHRDASFHPFPGGAAPDVRTYGWKPRLIAALAEELEAPFLWLDAATIVLGSLAPVAEQVAATGLWVPMAGGAPVRAHPDSEAYLDGIGIDAAWKSRRSRAAGVCAFDPRAPGIRELLQRWGELAQIEECLAPPGSHRGNHNFDQTILDALLYDGKAKGSWDLGTDELAISSDRPVDFLMARAKLPDWVPRWLDDPAVALLRTLRSLDVLAWRLRRRGRPEEPSDHPVRPADRPLV